MKILGIATFILVAIAAAFILGVTSNQTLLMFGGFCAWTPAAVFLGWAFARSGLRITVGSSQTYAPAVTNHRPASADVERQRRLRQPAPGAYDER